MSRSHTEIVIVGSGPMAVATAADLAARHHIAGAFTFKREPRAAGLTVPLLGSVDNLGAYLMQNPVDEVYFATDIRHHHDAVQQAVNACERLGIPFAIPAHSFQLNRALPADRRAVADGYLHYVLTVTHPVQDALKRAIDVTLAAVALVMLSPLLLGVAAGIKLTSRGPVFFHQLRVGLRGRYFQMIKFRSMVVDAEARMAALLAQNEQTGPVFKMARDPRITTIGRVIRKYSIDELPQLFNILRGDMSIVGPRPPVPSEVAHYLPWQRRRLSVRPGLTCHWQVQGRNQIGFDEWMYLDMQYVDHSSLRTDLRLVAQTIPVVVTGQGAS
ncbi:MAG: sugar transferase [Acidobacteria bacterium]|jgi:exopolysaccharide biosynthesis polyprenyl glycosylphosphotransferase|nr:sugar transferase [Acidobacteriota bacterium]